MNDEQEITGFKIVCENCQKANAIHHTTLYVDWNKKYYLIMCFSCGKSIAFDETGKEIELVKKQKEGN